ncbi:hydrogen gas-evolving membrane-bound hydrogenase subunit E, partial [Stenotrophomonas sp.]|uniref:hydrogen gas-evolving membrane-bound hydrogenase subunit E n=1 Tax=Stenotrophomonas sp. TaxID=69392 RepID=UPI0028A18A05
MRMAVSIAALLAGVFGVAYSLRFVHDTFFGKGPHDLDRVPHEPPRWMKVPVEILVVICVAVGVAPAITVAPVLHAAAASILGPAMPAYSLSVWHGFNLPLAMSAVGVLGGIALYFGLRRLINLHGVVTRATGRNLFHKQLDLVFGFAHRLTQALANGSLQRMLLGLVVVAIIVAAAPFVATPVSPNWPSPQPLPLLGWGLWLVMMACAFGALAKYRQRLLAVLLVGGVGLIVSLTFVFLSAPDLALTQLLVEMVTLVLMLLGMNYLPAQSPRERSRWRKGRDVLIAVLGGGGLAALAYTAMTLPPNTMAGELLARALPEAYGQNVVNVILVDFRGFDTFGEITVFGIAALVVHAMLRRSRMAPEQIMPGPPMKLPV